MQQASLTRAATDVLFGMSAAEFVRTHWNRSYCYARRGAAEIREAMGGSWSLPEWRKAIVTAYEWPGSARALGGEMRIPNLADGRQGASISLEPKQIESALQIGASVIGDILDARVSMLAAALKNELNMPGPVNTYASVSPDGQGSPVHFDPFHVFVIQLEGSKTWQVSRQPVVADPSSGRFLASDGRIIGRQLEEAAGDQVELGELVDVTLEPGDVLYVPAGMAHATKAIGQSLAVMINFEPPRFGTLVETIVRRVLNSDVQWRGLPAGGPDGAHLDQVSAGLARVREALAGLDGQSDVVKAAWNEMTAHMGDVQNSYAASFRPPANQTPVVEPHQRLRVTNRFPVRWAERTDGDGEVQFVVFLGSEEISDTGAGAEFLKNIVEHAEFTADEARHWSGESYDWDVVGSYLERLLQQGLLIVA